MDNNEKTSNLFSDLEHLGFNDIDKLDLYGNKAKEEEKISPKETEEDKEKSLLYDKEVICPVCGVRFNVRTVKASAARTVKKDSDLFIRYSNINPYFYDVWLCNSCGYSAMKRDFEQIKEHQKESVNKSISNRWKGKKYPDTYDVDIAIERYKLALLNYVVINAKNSSKAMTCLKIAWMYRLKEDEANEQSFLKQALEGMENAYFNEDFPIYGMDRFTTMYLIGELCRRTGEADKAMQWFSKVITNQSAAPRLKDLARDQKDLIKLEQNQTDMSLTDVSEKEKSTEPPKKGFFKSLFGGN